MCYRLFSFLLIGVLGTTITPANPTRFPLAPESLNGPDIFTEVESSVAQAAQKAGLSFTSDPRPLPPQVILTLDTLKGTVQKRNGLLFWRGDMLPDQLAPEDIGTLIRKKQQPDGTWKTTRTRKDFMRSSRTNLLPVVRSTPQGPLPPMIIETAYHLGTAGMTEATLVLWRTAEEGTAPLAGFILLAPAPTNLIQAMTSTLPSFKDQSGWTTEINALSP